MSDVGVGEDGAGGAGGKSGPGPGLFDDETDEGAWRSVRERLSDFGNGSCFRSGV